MDDLTRYTKAELMEMLQAAEDDERARLVEIKELHAEIKRLEMERVKDEIKHTITWEQYEALRRNYEDFIFMAWRERQKAA